jgi:hypothetical protein
MGKKVNVESRFQSSVPVETRIDRKLQYLRDVLNNVLVVDDWENFPRTPTAYREYADETIGLVRIPRPNDFLRNHPDWGSKINEIHALLKKINCDYPARKPRQPSQPLGAQLSRANVEVKDLRRQLVALSGEITLTRKSNEILTETLKTRDRSNSRLDEENQKLKREVKEFEGEVERLKKLLAEKPNLRIVR